MQDFDGKLNVLFANTLVSPLPGQIIIVPVSDGWNDFGFKIRSKYVARMSDDDEQVSGEMFIGFLPPKNASVSETEAFNERRVSVSDVLDEHDQRVVSSKDAPFFFTMHPGMSFYRKLVRALGPGNADVLLRSVNDLVIYKYSQNAWVEQALTSEVFSHGFMRDSEPFFAFNNADSVLGGVDAEDFSAISQKLDLTFSLEGYENPHEIKLRFSSESLIPRRINILIGKNGTGKSQALKSFCRAALMYRDSTVNLVDSEREDKRPMISRILAIATPGETGNTFPPERKKTQKMFYRRLNLTRNGRAGSSRSISESLVQLARSNDEIGAFTRWGLFLGAIEDVLPVDSIVIAQKGGDYLPIGSLRSGGESTRLTRWANVDHNADPRLLISENAYPLSSGQLTFFKFCLLCCLYIENGSFVLMDEPETHMHPNLISEFVGLLDYLLQNTGSQAILATHSAYFVREVPKEQVQVFHETENHIINVDNPRLRTFGATVDAISQFVFSEDAEVRLTDKIYEQVKGRTFDSVDKEIGEQISLAALMDLRRRMEGDH